MPNLITGLKYQAPYQKVETEEQLMEVFSDLKKHFETFTSNFKFTSPDKKAVESFRQFLEIATAIDGKPTVVLTGSGNIGGLVVNDASLEYDLSSVSALTKYWDTYRDGTCHSCHKIGREFLSQDESRWYCAIDIKPMKWHDCPSYDAHRKNSQGKAARTLAILVAEATK